MKGGGDGCKCAATLAKKHWEKLLQSPFNHWSSASSTKPVPVDQKGSPKSTGCVLNRNKLVFQYICENAVGCGHIQCVQHVATVKSRACGNEDALQLRGCSWFSRAYGQRAGIPPSFVAWKVADGDTGTSAFGVLLTGTMGCKNVSCSSCTTRTCVPLPFHPQRFMRRSGPLEKNVSDARQKLQLLSRPFEYRGWTDILHFW